MQLTSHANYTPMTVHTLQLTPTTSDTQPQAIKHDGDKPELALVPAEAVEEIAKAFTFGAKKYSANNWRHGMRWTRVASALLRHTYAWMRGEKADPESGLSHLAHAGACLCFLLTYEATGTGTDDRYKQQAA